MWPASRVTQVEPLSFEPGRAVVRVTVAGLPEALVVKVAAGSAAPGRGGDFERTAAATALAAAAGVPTADVLTARSARDGEPGHLVQRSVAGVGWRALRPHLDDDEVRSVHRQLAHAVLALQTTRLSGFGDLDAAGRPPGDDLLTALHRRADP